VLRIEVLSDASGPSIYLDVGLDALVPLAVCGEGLVRLFSIILELIASRGAGMSVQIQNPKLLIVEGRDAELFFDAALSF